MEKRIQVIKNYNDANLLLKKGHKILKIDRDKNSRNYLIFLFENNEELQKDLRNITGYLK
ncbi:TPA: hypothetical protein N2D78_003477 [Clostridium botulinum]|uniref:DUF5659 domain-containing protein n=1 Tax=Clostridium botulinum TaxID=1491 RepID=UPI000774006C|nr:DUF5659 domain-containing protein [Clostridium botulinum]HCL4466677.1 hypothetical protein [Clostridium botulinum]HCL4470319.1 hypothetical protein [Clostridium botulinum]HCL4485523.1 hypothetical protein [Clostridium botulinum]HCL4496281.1 hypothetical protein [Clostridium botulinum]HCL4499881.1 hypothetical protein [Clostridium botulinum]